VIAILLGIAALCSLVSTFIGDHSLLFQELGAFLATAVAAVLLESAAELLDVLYDIRDRLPERLTIPVSPEVATPPPEIAQPQPVNLERIPVTLHNRHERRS
jgi:hypothetical protein